MFMLAWGTKSKQGRSKAQTWLHSGCCGWSNGRGPGRSRVKRLFGVNKGLQEVNLHFELFIFASRTLPFSYDISQTYLNDKSLCWEQFALVLRLATSFTITQPWERNTELGTLMMGWSPGMKWQWHGVKGALGRVPWVFEAFLKGQSFILPWELPQWRMYTRSTKSYRSTL